MQIFECTRLHTCLQLQRIHSKRYTLTEQYCVFSGKNDDKISEIIFSTTNVGYYLVAKLVALYLNSGYGALLLSCFVSRSEVNMSRSADSLMKMDCQVDKDKHF
ncbi:hypothetical protein T10_10037 [Trichinella papuae]|uniref:Uncharacterized protein n=1 Tax=Trichinella papuae TaxID=268474 RepID=A0A0V1MNJ9_9BILA|nr:hypothetical protein T10_10037 [Trichinella papuae]